MGVRMLLNEAETIERDGARMHLAGIDDAHFFRVDNIEKAAAAIPPGEFSLLLSHTPEVYRQAAHAGFDVTAGRPYPWRPDLPAGRYADHAGFRPAAAVRRRCLALRRHGRLHLGRRRFSMVAVRLNCLPEITLHRLECGAGQ